MQQTLFLEMVEFCPLAHLPMTMKAAQGYSPGSASEPPMTLVSLEPLPQGISKLSGRVLTRLELGLVKFRIVPPTPFRWQENPKPPPKPTLKTYSFYSGFSFFK